MSITGWLRNQMVQPEMAPETAQPAPMLMADASSGTRYTRQDVKAGTELWDDADVADARLRNQPAQPAGAVATSRPLPSQNLNYNRGFDPTNEPVIPKKNLDSFFSR